MGVFLFVGELIFRKNTFKSGTQAFMQRVTNDTRLIKRIVC